MKRMLSKDAPGLRDLAQALTHDRELLLCNISIASFVTCFVVNGLSISPFINAGLNTFARVMGVATVRDHDISALINSYYIDVFLLVPVLFLGALVLCSLLCKKNGLPEDGETAEELKAAAVISTFCVVGTITKLVWPTEANTVIIAAYPLCMISVILFVAAHAARSRISNKAPIPSAETLGWGLCIALATMMPVHLLVSKIVAVPYWLVYGVVALCTSFAFFVLERKIANPSTIKIATTPLFFATMALSVCLEARNVLNQYGVFIRRFRAYVFVVMCVLVALCVTTAILLRKREGANARDWRTVAHPVILFSLAMIFLQPGLQTVYETGFFEQANFAVSTTDFLLFGELPVIETHGAHMFSDYVWRILFGLVNGNAMDAVFSNYDCIGTSLGAVILYFMLKAVCDKRIAFLSVLLLPIIGRYTTGICFITVLGMMFADRRRSFPSFLLFWLAAVLGVLYVGDIGLALGMGCGAALCVKFVVRKRWGLIAKLMIAFAAVAVACLALFFVLCAIRHVDALPRLREFMQVMAGSNQNWAYGDLGDSTRAIYWVVYTAMPVVVMVLAACCALSAKRTGELGSVALLLVAAFAAAYVANMPRALVRHSLYENNYVLTVSFVVWIIPLSLALINRNARRYRSVVVPLAIAATMLTISAVGSQSSWLPEDLTPINGQVTLLNGSLFSYDDGEIAKQRIVNTGDESYKVVENVTETVDRAVVSSKMKAVYEQLGKVLDLLLEDDETWVDFTNQTLLYSLLKRNNPVYVNQSPGLLSGEGSQVAFIDEVASAKTPIALMPAYDSQISTPFLKEIDGLKNSYRYYRVAEYIYQNYTPVATVGEFCVWAKPDHADAYRAKLTTEPMEVDLQDVALHNMEAVLSDDGIDIASTDADPQIVLPSKAFLCKDDRSWGQATLEFDIEPTVNGTVLVYYAADGQSFTVDHSQSEKVVAGQRRRLSFTVPWGPSSRLRIDPTDGQSTISSIGLALCGAKLCDYTYMPYEAGHTYSLGAIPFLWGTRDTNNAKDNPPATDALTKDSNHVYKFDSTQIDKSAGNYVLLEIDAQETEKKVDKQASAVLQKKAGRPNKETTPQEEEEPDSALLTLVDSSNSPVCSFEFYLRDGKNTYLVRVSADSYWYTDAVAGLKVDAKDHAQASVVQAKILKGD